MTIWYKIPTKTDGTESYAIQVTLDAVDYLLAFDWNRITQAWYMTISLTDGTVLVAGIKIVIGISLTARWKDQTLPAGDFYAYDSLSQNREAGLTDLGSRVILTYYSNA